MTDPHISFTLTDEGKWYAAVHDEDGNIEWDAEGRTPTDTLLRLAVTLARAVLGMSDD